MKITGSSYSYHLVTHRGHLTPTTTDRVKRESSNFKLERCMTKKSKKTPFTGKVENYAIFWEQIVHTTNIKLIY